MKKFLVLATNGNETIELFTPVDYLRRLGISVDIVSTEESLDLKTSQGVSFRTDLTFDQIVADDYFGLYIPGGTDGAYSMRDNKKVINLIQNFNKEGKIIAAICAGPVVLNKAGILTDKKATSFPAMKEEMDKTGTYIDDKIVVTDGNITTGRGAAVTNYLALELARIIEGEESVEKLKYGTQQEAVERYFDFKF
ncbi:DJ-1 family glyoxalase III [Anaerococcus tetradius]|uniref:DJ-1 family protein n=1 Tax=Anaerococcus tetradius ATCC 35098 TaxID=525255 RepID=C2CIL4_9FIRM|nr:DJ-1 family glyoxalase III [Anaerococcus tetradius]EEI82610.1 DJ-1 family protein [Anaerococcus tetradius ATCC 35098]